LVAAHFCTQWVTSLSILEYARATAAGGHRRLQLGRQPRAFYELAMSSVRSANAPAEWRRWRTRVGSIFIGLLSGCALGPDFKPAAPPAVVGYLPAVDPSRTGDLISGQTLIRGGEISGRWWESFRSPHLNDLIECGIEHNPNLQAAEAGVRMAQANASAQAGALFPVIGANFNPTRQEVPQKALITNAANGADIYSLHTGQLTVAYVADVFGGVRRQVESAQAQTELQSLQREGVYITLTSNIALAAIQEASLRSQIAKTRRIIELQAKLLDILNRQNERGQIAEPDVVTQETAVAQVKLLLPPLERQLAQQRNLIAVLTGRFPGNYVEPSFDLASFHLPRQLPLSFPADLVRQRPDIRAAEAAVHAANAQVGVAMANRFPQITLTGNVGSSALAFSQLFSPGTAAWLMAGNVAETLFDAGTLRSREAAAEENWHITAAQYQSTVLAAFQNVADALRALQADSRTLSAAITAEDSAARGIELVRRQVERGQVSLPILLNAEQAYLQTSLAHVQAEAARLADTVALFQALGGGWWNSWQSQIVFAVNTDRSEIK
jgi:NodT family efflux transporter outer membrane factor (OMF) lipoprotein